MWSYTEYGGFLENQFTKNSIITGSFNKNIIWKRNNLYLKRLIL